MKIIIDAMGGDFAPEAPVRGALLAREKYGADIILTGRTADILRAESDLLDAQAAALLPPEGTTLLCAALLSAPEALRPRMLRLLTDRLGAGKKDFTAAHYRALSDLLEGGGMLTLPAGACAVCRGETLTLLPPGPPLAPVVLHPGKNFWGEYTISVRKTAGNFSHRSDTIVLNCDKIDGALSVGPYTGGQRLTLPGSRGGRSVKRLLADRGIPPELRQRVPVLCVGDRPAAVWGVGVDRRFLPEDSGQSIYYIIRENYGG